MGSAQADLKIVYYVVPGTAGWRVRSRGFSWDFDSFYAACDFACTMAEQYALASGRATAVRVQDADGGFDEVKAYGGVARLPLAVPMATARRS